MPRTGLGRCCLSFFSAAYNFGLYATKEPAGASPGVANPAREVRNGPLKAAATRLSWPGSQEAKWERPRYFSSRRGRLGT
jgi:hypothetical protein